MTKAEIQLVRALADKRGRTEHGLFVAEGEKLIGELRGSHLKVRKIFALEGVFAGPEVETVAPRDMERLSLLKTAANSLAIVETPRYGLDMRSLAGRLTLALDDVQNPGNLGYYARTLSRLAGPAGRVYAVEPVPPILAVLRRNLRRCRNVEILPYALGTENKPDRKSVV